MAIAKKCDICERLYEPYNEQKNLNDCIRPNGFMYLNIATTCGNSKYACGKANDCCPVCMGSITDFIDSLVEAGEVEPENPDTPTPDPEEPPIEPDTPGEEGSENNE